MILNLKTELNNSYKSFTDFFVVSRSHFKELRLSGEETDWLDGVMDFVLWEMGLLWREVRLAFPEMGLLSCAVSAMIREMESMEEE